VSAGSEPTIKVTLGNVFHNTTACFHEKVYRTDNTNQLRAAPGLSAPPRCASDVLCFCVLLKCSRTEHYSDHGVI
jgi:hypothetical protein